MSEQRNQQQGGGGQQKPGQQQQQQPNKKRGAGEQQAEVDKKWRESGVVPGDDKAPHSSEVRPIHAPVVLQTAVCERRRRRASEYQRRGRTGPKEAAWRRLADTPEKDFG
jgi:hypothetical protein